MLAETFVVGADAVVSVLACLEYNIKVSVCNTVGCSDFTDYVTSVPVVELGAPPINLAFDSTIVHDGSTLTLTWDSSEDDGGTPVIDFGVYFKDKDSLSEPNLFS